MSNPPSSLEQLRGTILAQGVVDAESVRQLRAALPADRPCNDAEAETLFAIHDATVEGANDAGWTELFVAALTARVFGRPRGLDEAAIEELLARVDADGRIEQAELRLIVHLMHATTSTAPRARAALLAAIKRSVLQKDRIARSDVELIRRIIYGPPHRGNLVDREEADFLLALNSAMTGRRNHASWGELFVEAITHRVLHDERSPGVVDAAEAAWLIERIEADEHYDDNERRLLAAIEHRVEHNELWGGIHSDELQASASGIHACLFARGCQGGRGGDVYYISVSAGGLFTRIAIADVMGHGPQVSDISQGLYQALSARINGGEGSAILSELNRLAVEHGYRAMTTAAVVTLHRAERSLAFAYAGHLPLALCRRAQGCWQWVPLEEQPGLANLPLGIDLDTRFDQQRIDVAPGDRIFLYTDGVIEAPDAQGECFGSERLLATLQAQATAPIQNLKKALIEALTSHTGGPLAHDDVTLLIVEIE